MKRLMKPLKQLTCASLLLGSFAVVAAAQIISGCDDWIVIRSSSDPNREVVCRISSADEEWCYYSCG